MEPVFNERKLRAWLEPLSRLHRAAFVLACCERLHPTLMALHSESGAGDPEALRHILDAVWSLLEGRDPAVGLPSLAEQCRRAPLAASLLLETIETGSLDKAIEAAAVASEVVESYAQQDLDLAPDAPDTDARIAAHPLVQREIRRQRDDIRLLHRTPLDRPESVADLRRKWRDGLE